MEALPEELVTAVSERRAILFAGAGLSMSVGLPSWQEFVARLREELDLTAEEATGSAVSHHTLAEYYRIKQNSW
jgi:hypothetical protein